MVEAVTFPSVTPLGRSKPTQSCEWLRHSVATSRHLAAPLNQVLGGMRLSIAILLVLTSVSCTDRIDTTTNLVVLEDEVIFAGKSFTDSNTLSQAIASAERSVGPIPMITPCSSDKMVDVAHNAIEAKTVMVSLRTSSDISCIDWKEKHVLSP